MEGRPKISQWSKSDRPKDKLFEKTPRDLSNAELLSILLGPGNAKLNSLELAQMLLSGFHGKLSQLSKCSLHKLMEYYGVGMSKAATIMAFAELSRRREAEKALDREHIPDSASAAGFLMPLLADYPHEVFGVMFLNAARYLLAFEILFQGGITGVATDIRIIMKRVLYHGAVKIIVAHNHPSGCTYPSFQDDDFTSRLHAAAKVLDITLMDHIIVGDKTYYSFLRAGKLDS